MLHGRGLSNEKDFTLNDKSAPVKELLNKDNFVTIDHHRCIKALAREISLLKCHSTSLADVYFLRQNNYDFKRKCSINIKWVKSVRFWMESISQRDPEIWEILPVALWYFGSIPTRVCI